MSNEFNNFDQVFADIDDTVNKLVRKTAFDAQASAQGHSRVRYGFMKNAWYVRTEDDSTYQSLSTPKGYAEFPEVEPTNHNEAWIVGGMAHTVFNEFGTIHMSAQPMITPAIEEVREPFLDALAVAVHGERR